jgi:hypothetical protein
MKTAVSFGFAAHVFLKKNIAPHVKKRIHENGAVSFGISLTCFLKTNICGRYFRNTPILG